MKSNYRLSFTTGGLFLRESLELLALHRQFGDWAVVRTEAVESNTLQLRTTRSAHRVAREVIARLMNLSEDELRIVGEGSPEEQRLMLWLAVCRLYRFIAEFAREVLHEHFVTLKPEITLEDFDIFFNRKAEWHDGLDAISPTTRKKLRQVLFRMMREASLLNANYMILPVILSPQLQDMLTASDESELDYFPAYPTDLRKRAY